jgi:PAS domain-containing protein
MLGRHLTLVLIAAAEYVAVVAILLGAVTFGGPTVASVGALGAALAAACALVSLYVGKRIGRREAEARAAGRSRRAQAQADPAPAAATPAAPHPARPHEAARRGGVSVAELSRDLSFLSHFFVDVVDALPTGFATLDQNLVVRSTNRALKQRLGLSPDEPMIGLPLADTPLGAAVYNGPRTLLAGRALSEIATDLAEEEQTLDLAPLLVAGPSGGWAARLCVHIHRWPRRPAPCEQFFLWLEDEPLAHAATGAAAESTAAGAPVEEVSLALTAHDDRRDAEILRTREKLLDEMLLRDALLASIPIGVLVLDSRGSLLSWSDSASDLLGDEIALRDGAAIAAAWPAFATEANRARLAALLESGAPFTSTLPRARALAAGAARRERSVRGAPVGVPGEAPRRVLLLVEERIDADAVAAFEAELAVARTRTAALAARLPEVRSRLDTISSIARFLAATLTSADIRTLSEIKMIEIQRGRIEAALREAAGAESA